MERKKIKRVYRLMLKANNLHRTLQIIEQEIIKTQEKEFGQEIADAINNDSEYQDGLAGVGGYSNAELGSLEEFEEIVNRVEQEVNDG